MEKINWLNKEKKYSKMRKNVFLSLYKSILI